MMPFHFGTRERRLFGVYDPAQRIVGPGRAAVICPPWGEEYTHAHRTLRQLAMRLSQNGFHVLRFDYYGTGDSGGDTGDNDTAGTRMDVETAVAELKEMTGVARPVLIGLRFGAILAAYVSVQRKHEVDALVLWDPLAPDELVNPTASRRAAKTSRFAAADLALQMNGLPSRTLLLTMQNLKPGSFGPLETNHLAGAPPWIEAHHRKGKIPVNVLQHIVRWLG